MTKVLVGADPELWIIDRKTNKPISADGLFEGTKDNPTRVTHGAIQVDGMAAEFNIDPVDNEVHFVRNTLSVLRDLRDTIKRNNPTLEFEFGFTPVANFGKEYIDAQPEEAKRLGCTPDFNAYENGAMNPIPDAELPFRTASGHIHVGWDSDLDVKDPDHIEACCMMVKQLDAAIGIYFPNLEGPDGLKRRELYGKAGAFRPKPYGVEYRTPSNVWLNNILLMKNVFNRTSGAFRDLMTGDRMYEWGDEYQNIRKFIDKGDIDFINGYWGPLNKGSVRGQVTVNSLDQLLIPYEPSNLFPVEAVLAPAPNRRGAQIAIAAPNPDWVNVGVNPAFAVADDPNWAPAPPEPVNFFDDIEEDDQPDVDFEGILDALEALNEDAA